jgi:ubiquitin-conjugating enzyme E2 Z
MKDPVEHIHYANDEENIFKGYALIVGPKDTPYENGFYLFEFTFPENYPFSPPELKFHTYDGFTRFNPNLYKCGKVCISILNTWVGDKWSSCQTINSILLTLCSLLNNAPLENEPGHNKNSKDFIPYQKSIEFKNIDFAICDIINRNKNNIPDQFLNFYPFMKTHFINNYDKLLEYIKSKNTNISFETVAIYQMYITIDYATLEQKLIKTKEIIDSDNTENFDKVQSIIKKNKIEI